MSKKSLMTFCLLCGLSPVLTGCGTIMSGSDQKVSFSSTPSNALVIVDGGDIGNTPLTKELARKKEHTVVIRLDGYKPYEITLKKQTNGWVWGNIIFGGVIGVIVDSSTGALYELTPEQVNADLKLKGLSSSQNDSKNLYIAVTLIPHKSWKKIGTLVNQ